MAGKITTNSVVLGDSITDTQNFVLKTNADGTATLARGALGGLGTVFGVNASGALTGATLVAPALGTPASGVLTNCTGVPAGALPAGSVLQVVSATKTDTSSFTSSTFADIGTLTVTITPRNTSSKFLVIASVSMSYAINVTKAGWRLMRDATPIAVGDAASIRARVTGASYVIIENYAPISSSTSYLDSPATASPIVYKCQGAALDNAGTVYVNRANIDNDAASVPRTASSITVFEIAG